MARQVRRHLLKVLVCVVAFTVVVSICLQAIGVKHDFSETQKDISHLYYRNILQQERWPEREQDESKPAEMSPTVHYLWCGRQSFGFHHYLGVLSAIRILHPTKIVIHYTDPPLLDDYNSWFRELTTSVPHLELVHVSRSLCAPDNVFKTLLSFFSQHGGVFLGPGLLLTQPPTFHDSSKIWVAREHGAGPTKVIVAVASGFDGATLLRSISSSSSSSPPAVTECASVHNFNDAASCVAVETGIHPRDIVTSPAPFAELARWLFYGSRATLEAKRDPSNLIPRISHYIKLTPAVGGELSRYETSELTFHHFLSIVSALYLGGFERVYLHADHQPRGRWWEELRKENVTFVPVDPPPVALRPEARPHQTAGDVTKYQVLDKYGGTYQDFDVVWLNRVPDWLLEYPAVVGLEWGKEPEFQESVNTGVLMARAGAQWLRSCMKAHQGFTGRAGGYSSSLVSYRLYELYPDAVHLDRHFQVVCWSKTYPPTPQCRHAWDNQDVRSSTHKSTDWKTEVRGFHIIGPVPHPSMASPEVLATRTGFFAQLGRNVLEKSGRLHVLPV